MSKQAEPVQYIQPTARTKVTGTERTSSGFDSRHRVVVSGGTFAGLAAVRALKGGLVHLVLAYRPAAAGGRWASEECGRLRR